MDPETQANSEGQGARTTPEAGAEPAIATHEVGKRFGKLLALDKVSIEVGKGEIYVLLGPNGSGKSTLIKLLVGASRPSSGNVRVLGLNPTDQALSLRRRIGYMPQSPALYEDLSARDNIRFFARGHGTTDLDQRVDETLAFVDLTERRNGPVYSFSGGMKQRVSLACALVHRPEVLFLDEPTVGVDPKLKESFWRHFRELASGGVTLFISTHLMDEALLCDRLTVLRAGGVLITATPQEITQRGKTRVSIGVDGKREVDTVRHYYTELPKLLRQYGLEPGVDRIELHEDPLETVIVDMIKDEPG